MHQRFKYRFRGLFKYEYDPMFPTMKQYILFVVKKPYEQKYVDRGNTGFSYISKFEWIVAIDLWFVLFKFQWVGREQDAKA